MEKKQKYIADAICWCGAFFNKRGYWLRIRDLNFLEDEQAYTPAARGGVALFIIRQAYPYEDWMEEYIGTDKNLMEDPRFKVSLI